jgi:hypothetical protein
MDAQSGTALSGSILNFAAQIQYDPESVNSYANPNSLLCGLGKWHPALTSPLPHARHSPLRAIAAIVFRVRRFSDHLLLEDRRGEIWPTGCAQADAGRRGSLPHELF